MLLRISVVRATLKTGQVNSREKKGKAKNGVSNKGTEGSNYITKAVKLAQFGAYCA